MAVRLHYLYVFVCMCVFVWSLFFFVCIYVYSHGQYGVSMMEYYRMGRD